MEGILSTILPTASSFSSSVEKRILSGISDIKWTGSGVWKPCIQIQTYYSSVLTGDWLKTQCLRIKEDNVAPAFSTDFGIQKNILGGEISNHLGDIKYVDCTRCYWEILCPLTVKHHPTNCRKSSVSPQISMNYQGAYGHGALWLQSQASVKLCVKGLISSHESCPCFCDTFILSPSDFFFFYFACIHKNYSQKIFICMWKAWLKFLVKGFIL